MVDPTGGRRLTRPLRLVIATSLALFLAVPLALIISPAAHQTTGRAQVAPELVRSSSTKLPTNTDETPRARRVEPKPTDPSTTGTRGATTPTTVTTEKARATTSLAPAATVTSTPAPSAPASQPAAVDPTPPTTVAPPATGPSVATLVAEVEADGIDPGPNWHWSMGDTSTLCGTIPDAGIATGCTSGAAGAATTVFSGVPTMALVAHEVANAETENDAVPDLVAEVTAAEAGTSWSPIDAVASCLVEHFMGFQDDAAGTWQCPPDLAATVAADIHETTTGAVEGADG